MSNNSPDRPTIKNDLTPQELAERNKIASAYVQCFTSEAGQIVMKQLASDCFETCFPELVESPVDPYRATLHQGHRVALQRIMTWIKLGIELGASPSTSAAPRSAISTNVNTIPYDNRKDQIDAVV